MKTITPKFNIGQTVKNKADDEVGVIESYSYDPEVGFRYKVTSREVDITAKEVINGYKTVEEKEIEAVKGKKGEEDEEIVDDRDPEDKDE